MKKVTTTFVAVSSIGILAIFWIFLLFPVKTNAQEVDGRGIPYTVLGNLGEQIGYTSYDRDNNIVKFQQLQNQIEQLTKANTDLQNRLNQTMTANQPGQCKDERFDNLNDRLRKVESLNLELFIKTVKKILKIK